MKRSWPFSAAANHLAHVKWSIADQALVSGTNFLTGILLVRSMGMSVFGMFTLAWMLVQFLNNLQTAIITSPMLSIGPKQVAEDRPTYYGAVLAEQLVFSTGSFVFVYTSMALSQVMFPASQGELLALPLATTAATFQLQDFMRRYFFATGRAASALLNDSISYLGQLVAIILLIRLNLVDAVNALWVISVTSGLAAVLGLCSMQAIAVDFHVSKRVLIRHWHFSKWLLIKTHLNQLTTYPLIWALGFFRGSEAVGILTACRNVVGVLHVAFLSLDNIIQPRASRVIATEGLETAIRFIQHITKWAAIPVITICLAAAIFPDKLISVFYGNVLVGHEEVLILFAAAYFLTFLEKPFSYVLLALEKTRTLAIVDGVKFLISITLCIPIVQSYGTTGVMALVVFLNLSGIAILLNGCAKSVSSHLDGLKPA